MIDRIGIIGTGAIAEAIVDGIRVANGDRPTIILSPRNAQTASSLARRHPNVHVGEDNQAVVDAAPTILLAVRPDAVREVLGDLRMPGDGVLISAVAGWSIEALREHLDVDVEIVRTIPLLLLRAGSRNRASIPRRPTTTYAACSWASTDSSPTVASPYPSSEGGTRLLEATMRRFVPGGSTIRTRRRWPRHSTGFGNESPEEHSDVDAAASDY